MKKTVIAVVIVTAVALGGYMLLHRVAPSSGPQPTSPTAAGVSEPKKLEEVTFRLSWVHDLAYAGEYLAKDKGYFEEEGLDVSIEPGGFGLDPIKQVAAGADAFGIAGAGNLLMAREKGIPIVAIGIYFQRSGVAFVTRKESGITSFRQFRGKRIGIQTGSDTDVLYRALLVKSGMTSADVHEVPIQYDMAPFLNGQIDVLPGYITNQPITLQSQGIAVNVISADLEGLNYYGSVYFTTEKMLRERPEFVARFMRALNRGWADAFEHKDEAIAATRRWAPEFSPADLPKIYDTAMPLIKPDLPGVPINGMNEERWRTTMKVMRDAGMLSGDVDLSRAYTMEFTK